MNRVKHSHIVPEFYLQYFTNKDRKIYVFDKPKFSSFESRPEKIGKIGGFYDIDEVDNTKQKQIIEYKLGLIETETAPIYNELINKLEANKFSGFTELERVVLSKFIQTQMLRTEGSRNTLEQANIEIQRQLKEKLTTDEFKIIALKIEETNAKSSQLSLINTQLENSNHQLINRIWTIHKNVRENKFLTSDHPVCIHNHGNAFNTQHEIFLPLSPKYLLSILIPEQFSNFRSWNNKVLDLNEEVGLQWYNSVIILKAERQVYSSENNFNFVEKALKDQTLHISKNQPRIETPIKKT